MSKLGGTSHSVNPDLITGDNPGEQGPPGPPGPPGPAGEGFPVGGTTGQVLAKTSNTDYDTEWTDPSGGVGSSNPAYGSGQIISGIKTNHTEGLYASTTMVANLVIADPIYFDGSTTISEARMRCAGTSSGGTLHIALHPIISQGNFGTQAHATTITVGTAAGVYAATGLNWTPAEGWYVLVNWSAATITSMSHLQSSSNNGSFGNGDSIMFLDSNYTYGVTSERSCLALYKNDYDVSPDLTGIDFNDVTALTTTGTTNGDLRNVANIPIVGLVVA